MLLYLVQHAEAKREEEDSARPLSGKGLEDIKKVASHLSSLNINVDQILHSTKLRAEQTAEVLSENLKPSKGILKTDGLSPLDDPALWAENLKNVKDNTMFVGHLPHLAKLASLLLCGDAEKNIIAFKMAGIVCLKRDDNRAWSLQWMITPEVIS